MKDSKLYVVFLIIGTRSLWLYTSKLFKRTNNWTSPLNELEAGHQASRASLKHIWLVPPVFNLIHFSPTILQLSINLKFLRLFLIAMFLVAKLHYKYLSSSVSLSVRFRGKLIKIEFWFLRASLLMDVVILVFSQITQII